MSVNMEMLSEEGLQEVARAQVYAYLSQMFARPSSESLAGLRDGIPSIISALNYLDAMHEVRHACGVVTTLLREVDPKTINHEWYSCFDPSGGLLVPPTETHYTADSPAHGMTRGYEMADVAAFYKAFGVEVTEGSERPDHLLAELDFLHLLALKTAVAISKDNKTATEICRQAKEKFMVEHVVRWVGLFCQLLNETDSIGPFYPAAGRLLLVFLQEQIVTTPGVQTSPSSPKEVNL